MALRFVSKFGKPPSSPTNLFPFLRSPIIFERNSCKKLNRLPVQFPLKQNYSTASCGQETPMKQMCVPQQKKIIIEISENGIKMFEGYLMEFSNDLLKGKQFEMVKKIAEDNVGKFKKSNKANNIGNNCSPKIANIGPPQPQKPKWLNTELKNGQKKAKNDCGAKIV